MLVFQPSFSRGHVKLRGCRCTWIFLQFYRVTICRKPMWYKKNSKKELDTTTEQGEFNRGFYLVMFVTLTPWEFSGFFPPVVVASGKGSQSLYAQHARGGLGQDLCALRAGAIVMKTVDIHPWRLTWNIIVEVWKIMFLSKWVICRFHVNHSRVYALVGQFWF